MGIIYIKKFFSSKIEVIENVESLSLVIKQHCYGGEGWVAVFRVSRFVLWVEQ